MRFGQVDIWPELSFSEGYHTFKVANWTRKYNPVNASQAVTKWCCLRCGQVDIWPELLFSEGYHTFKVANWTVLQIESLNASQAVAALATCPRLKQLVPLSSFQGTKFQCCILVFFANAVLCSFSALTTKLKKILSIH